MELCITLGFQLLPLEYSVPGLVLGDRIAATQLASLLLLCVFLVIIIERYSRQSAKYQNLTERTKEVALFLYQEVKHLYDSHSFMCNSNTIRLFNSSVIQLLFWAIKTAPEIINSSFYALVFNTIKLALIVAVFVM